MDALLTTLFGSQLDKAAMWAAVAASVALTGVLVAWRQLARIRATSQADFTFRFIESFFIPDTRLLFALLDSNLLSFSVVEVTNAGERICRITSLHINSDAAGELSGMLSIPEGKTSYHTQEIDDLLLGHFESLGWYVKNKLISFDSAYQNFSYYVTRCFEHEEIRKYLADQDNKGIYEDFPWIYQQFRRRSAGKGR